MKTTPGAPLELKKCRRFPLYQGYAEKVRGTARLAHSENPSPAPIPNSSDRLAGQLESSQ
jgi:hypothetical protein